MARRPSERRSKTVTQRHSVQKPVAHTPVNPEAIIPGGLGRFSASERARASGQDPRNKREPKAQRTKDELRDREQGLLVRVAQQQGLSRHSIEKMLNYISHHKKHTRNVRQALEEGAVPQLGRLIHLVLLK